MRHFIALVNLGWASWALFGGVYFMLQAERFVNDPVVMVFGQVAHGYSLVGISLLVCGVVSFLALPFRKFAVWAAILCAVWCAGVAVVLQIASVGTGAGYIISWLLWLCAFTCVMRWGLLVLEPHVCE